MFLTWGLSCPVPQLFIGDVFWPLDVKDVSETSVSECLKLVAASLSHMPYFLSPEVELAQHLCLEVCMMDVHALMEEAGQCTVLELEKAKSSLGGKITLKRESASMTDAAW